jgi:hypothetical protein
MPRPKKGTPEYDQWIKNLSESHKGLPSGNKGKFKPEGTKRKYKKRIGSWNKNQTLSEAHKEKLRQAAIERLKDPKYSNILKEICVNRPAWNKGKELSYNHKLKLTEIKVGGFWYGAIPKEREYCIVWEDVKLRVKAFFDNKCVLCGSPENGKFLVGHHIFYVKKACCWFNDDGEYYTNLNAKDHKEHDYFIGDNPNYFVPLCPTCHGLTGGNFENRKKWANYFKELIDTYYGGKCYLSEKEMADLYPPSTML